MSLSVAAVVKVGAVSHELRFDACRVFLGGEFAGNIEVDIACDAGAVGPVVERLQVQVPGAAPTGMALGNGAYAPGVQLVFWSDPSDRPAEVPDEVILLWDETPIARIEPALEDSVPVEQAVEWIEPSQILDTFPVATSSLVPLAARRQTAWLVLAVALACSGALVAAALPGLGLLSPTWIWTIAGTLLAASAWAGLYLYRVPYRQFWLDRDRRRVLVLEGRARDPQSRLADAPARPLDDFDHVRVYMRWSMAHSVEDHDQEVWSVALEGPVPFAGGDGGVHLRADALELGEFSSAARARHVAAVVAYHTGLKILDTGHDQTA